MGRFKSRIDILFLSWGRVFETYIGDITYHLFILRARGYSESRLMILSEKRRRQCPDETEKENTDALSPAQRTRKGKGSNPIHREREEENERNKTKKSFHKKKKNR